MMNKRARGSVAVILMSWLALWWSFLVFAVVSGANSAWTLVQWSPAVLIPWAVVDIARAVKR